jgi:hypothetical protein
MLNCAGGGRLTQSRSIVFVPRSSMQKAADEYLTAKGSAGIKFDLRLYLINHTAAKAGADPRVVFDSADPADVNDTRVINSLIPNGADCTAYYIKDFGRDEFRKLTAGSRSGVSSSEKQGLKPTGSEKNPFRDPGIRLAMSRQTWHEIGARAGWIKSAQQQPDSLQIQKNMDENVNNQQQEAQDAQNAQQSLAALVEKEKELKGKKQQIEEQIKAMQRTGRGIDPKALEPLNAQLMQINEELGPVQEGLNEAKELNNTLNAAKNPRMEAGLKLARKEIS